MTTVGGVAPVYAALDVPCGADYVVQVSYVDDATGLAVNVSTPRMQIRADPYPTATLLLTPTLTVAANVVTVTVPGSATKALFSSKGHYDLFATRVDTGQEVKLAYGPVAFVAAVTAL